VDTLATTGGSFLLMAAAIALAGFLAVMLLGQYVFRMSTDDLFGVVSARREPGHPRVCEPVGPQRRIDVAFATIYPSTTS